MSSDSGSPPQPRSAIRDVAVAVDRSKPTFDAAVATIASQRRADNPNAVQPSGNGQAPYPPGAVSSQIRHAPPSIGAATRFVVAAAAPSTAGRRTDTTNVRSGSAVAAKAPARPPRHPGSGTDWAQLRAATPPPSPLP